MSATHISVLPEDVLINIFEHLNGNKKQSNLINATLVCKKWNRIISQTHSLMDKLQLKLDFESFQDNASLKDLKFTRFYRHVVWNDDCVYGDVPSKIFDEISKLDHLNTLEVSDWNSSNAEMMENLRKLSRCKFLRSLIFKDCQRVEEDGQELEEIQRVELKNLRNLQLIGSSSFFLNSIKCKELDNFINKEPHNRRNINSDNQTIAFLNQLYRCDEISIEFRDWNFGNDFKLKFLWKKLKMICRCDYIRNPNDASILGIKSFLEASTLDAECDIEFSGFISRSSNNHFWLTVLNSCRKITTLTLDSLTLPSDLTCLRDLPEVRTLRIAENVFEDVDKFSYFTSKVKNVTKLDIFSLEGITNEFYFTDHDARWIYQKFLHQITELTFNSHVVDLNSWRNGIFV